MARKYRKGGKYEKETNCYCIYKTKNNNDDANYDLENNNYKEELLKIINKNKIKLLLDIHGASDKYGFGIDIATDNEINLNDKEIVLKILKLNGIGIFSCISSNSESLLYEIDKLSTFPERYTAVYWLSSTFSKYSFLGKFLSLVVSSL